MLVVSEEHSSAVEETGPVRSTVLVADDDLDAFEDHIIRGVD
jgi:hypothetical protein